MRDEAALHQIVTKTDKISGDAIPALFEELHRDAIPLKIRSVRGEYENRTCIEEIRRWKRNCYFQIQPGEEFRKAVVDSNDWWLRFEYSGKDDIKYAFETREGEISRNMAWIKLPEIVYRYQRRHFFRLEAPPGTRLYLPIEGIRYRLLVIDVSLGGTLGALVSMTKKMESELQLGRHQSLESVELIFPGKDNDEDSKVYIKKCRIARHRKNPLNRMYECALEFTEIDEEQQKKLSALFYRWQRDYLRKRKTIK